MRVITKIFAVALLAITLLLGGCNRGATPQVVDPGMAVTYSTIDGSWELIAWNGAELDEATVCYVDFDRTERRFEMWDNFDSMYAVKHSGTFTIEENEYGEYILSGTYDYGVGDWNDSYTVTMYTPGHEMRWESVATGDTYTFAKIDAIPELN